MKLRPYQKDCLDAIRTHFRESNEAVIVSAPTGSGKTIIFSNLIQGIYERVPRFRVLIVAHRKQMLEQAKDKLLTVAPDLESKVGIYSAGLNKREMNYPITVAGIQSIHRRAFEFEPFDLIIIDEVHNFSEEEGTTYKKFIDNCIANNNDCKVLGFTATSYRLKGGSIYGKDRLFKNIVYKIDIKFLINNGYLCSVSAKHAKSSQDFSNTRLIGGDFNKLEVEMILNKEVLVRETVKEIIELSEGRQKVLIFCCSIKHAILVQEAMGLENCCITHSKMTKEMRGINEERFTKYDAGFLVNIGVLTEGWDCPELDCIVLLRPTASPGLYVQMVGRGLRIKEDGRNCLILDFSGNIERHGAIDLVEEIMERKKREKISPKSDCQMMKCCPKCETYIHIACRECLECGYIFPEREFIHDHKAGTGAIISTDLVIELITKEVTGIFCTEHTKEKTSLKVQYVCGLEIIPEWICLEHSGYPLRKAIYWWQNRFSSQLPKRVKDLDFRKLEKELFTITKSISVIKKGNYFEIKKYVLDFDGSKLIEA